MTRIIGGRFGGKRGEIGREILGSITESVRVAACELHGRKEENKEEKGSYEFVSDFGYHVSPPVTRFLRPSPLPPHVSPPPLPSQPLLLFAFFKSNRNVLILGTILFR